MEEIGLYKKKLTNEEFDKRLEELNSDLIRISEYNGISKKIKIKCLVCNREFEVIAE